MVEKCIDCYFYPSCMCNFHFQHKLQTHFYFSHSYPIHWPSCQSATLKTPSTTGEAKFAARDLSIHLFSTPLTLIIRVAADPAPADFTWRDGNTMDRWPAISHHSEQRAIVTVKLTLPPNKFPCTKKLYIDLRHTGKLEVFICLVEFYLKEKDAIHWIYL